MTGGASSSGSEPESDEGTTERPPPPAPQTTGPMDDTDGCVVGSLGCPCTAGGACDPGLACEANACADAPPACGNGVLEAGEECDFGDGNADDQPCKSDCTEQICGDGAVGPGEACDDGNPDDTDACTNACALASCGDGQPQQGEECDDANLEQTDGCLNTCLAAACGDSIVHAGVEECDDANADNGDDCLDTCVLATCGDGFLHAGVEACDDADADDADGCTSACECHKTFSLGSDIQGWALTGGWSIHSEAPMSTNPAVPFVTQGQVFGTDGNRVPPYPGQEAEMSTATTSSFTIPETLTFRSWHVDEGGVSYDQKRIMVSIDGGGSWQALVDCAAGIAANQPFCVYQGGPRDEGAWDDISLDAAAFAGVPGQLRFEYATGDTCCSFEQGWFIDDINALTCP